MTEMFTSDEIKLYQNFKVEENLVEEEERAIGRPGLRLRGFRRPRPRPRFRPPSRLRPQLQDNEERELEEMMAALGENSPLKAEFEKFMKEQLGTGTGPRRLAQFGCELIKHYQCCQIHYQFSHG